MQLRDGVALLLAAALVATGCSRLTFVKPKLERGEINRTAPEYTFKDDPHDTGVVAGANRVALAQQRLQAGELDDAESQARAAIKADPKSADAYTLLAVIEDQRGHPAEAGGHYARAVQLAPTRGTVLNNYGTWLCANGRAADSMSMFDGALADPAYETPAAALANAGSCALDLGLPRAENDLRRALALDPANPVALGGLAQLEYRAGNYLEARAFSERRLAAAPATREVLQLASQIEQKLGDTAAAARYVQRINTEFPPAGAVPSGEASQR